MPEQEEGRLSGSSVGLEGFLLPFNTWWLGVICTKKKPGVQKQFSWLSHPNIWSLTMGTHTAIQGPQCTKHHSIQSCSQAWHLWTLWAQGSPWSHREPGTRLSN